MHRHLRSGFALTLAMSVSACDTRTTLYVQSDTEWNGVLIGKDVDRWEETGNVYSELGKGTFCWEFSKVTDEGYLRAFVREESLFSSDEFHRDETTAPQGEVHGCITVG